MICCWIVDVPGINSLSLTHTHALFTEIQSSSSTCLHPLCTKFCNSIQILITIILVIKYYHHYYYYYYYCLINVVRIWIIIFFTRRYEVLNWQSLLQSFTQQRWWDMQNGRVCAKEHLTRDQSQKLKLRLGYSKKIYPFIHSSVHSNIRPYIHASMLK